jgi:phage terminase large subunit
MATATIIADQRMQDYAFRAAASGCPVDQTRRFIEAGYIAWPTMLKFHAAARAADRSGNADEIAIGGSRGPGKSHAIMAQVGLDDCQRVKGLKVLFLRKVQKAAAESLEDLTIRVFQYTPHELTANRVTFPNGSRILLGGYKDERDIEKYLGIEYDVIVLEEATQITESKKDKIKGSLRTSKTHWRTRMYLSTNADGVGLTWFKKLYVDPWRAGKETTSTRFFEAHYQDNPMLAPEYVSYLENLKGPLGKAWRDADWDAFAGMAFKMWNYDKHVIKLFDIPIEWPKWRAIDWGMAAPWCCLWLTRNPDSGRIYVYREAYMAELTSKQQAEYIKDMTPPHEVIGINYADPALWSRKDMQGKVTSTADEYAAAGILLTRADNRRIEGKRKVDDSMASLPDGDPGVQIFDSCPHLIGQLSTLVHDPINVEDIDTQQEDHAYDSYRYALTNTKISDTRLPPPTQPKNRTAGARYL